MLKIIVQQSQSLIAFISALNLALYQPQKRHLIRFLDALLDFGICSMQERAKTLGSRLNLESAAGEGTIITFALKLNNGRSHTEEKLSHE